MLLSNFGDRKPRAHSILGDGISLSTGTCSRDLPRTQAPRELSVAKRKESREGLTGDGELLLLLRFFRPSHNPLRLQTLRIKKRRQGTRQSRDRVTVIYSVHVTVLRGFDFTHLRNAL